MKLLLAEDDARLGRLIKHMLEAEQHQADWVLRGDEAMRQVADGIYDVLILDWMMPGLSGVEMCRQLREGGIFPADPHADGPGRLE